MSRVTVLVVGSLGDVLPQLALAEGLYASGMEVTVATHDLFEADVRARGLGFRPITVNPRTVLESAEGVDWLRSQSHPLRNARAMAAALRPILRSVFDDSWEACQGAEALVCNNLALWGHDIAESLRVPCVFTPLYPMRRTRFVPAVGAAPLPLGTPYNLLTHLLNQQFNWQPFRDVTNTWRAEVLGLPPEPVWGARRMMDWPGVPVLSGFSEAVLPRPRDWPEEQRITGYWFGRDAEATVEPRVAAFVEDGPPPVYIGFGSMVDPEPERLAGIVLDALRSTRLRAVVATGWGKVPLNGTDDVLTVETVPHSWLFPRVAAVVHHAGSGTTATALRTGAPSVTVHYFFDQPLWAHRIARLGAGSAPIPRQRLTAPRLASALRKVVNDPGPRDRAQTISRRLQAGDGVATAVGLINAHLGVST